MALAGCSVVVACAGRDPAGPAYVARGPTYVANTAATIRSGPGVQYPAIGTLRPDPYGSETVTERSRSGGWIETDRGWIWGKLLRPSGSAREPLVVSRPDMYGPPPLPPGQPPGVAPAPGAFESPAPAGSRPGVPPARGTAMAVVLDGADLRAAPSREARSLYRLGMRSEVLALRPEGEWVRVAFGDADGWMLRSHLKEKSQVE